MEHMSPASRRGSPLPRRPPSPPSQRSSSPAFHRSGTPHRPPPAPLRSGPPGSQRSGSPSHRSPPESHLSGSPASQRSVSPSHRSPPASHLSASPASKRDKIESRKKLEEWTSERKEMLDKLNALDGGRASKEVEKQQQLERGTSGLSSHVSSYPDGSSPPPSSSRYQTAVRELSPMLSRASPHNIMLAWNEANSSRSTSPTYDRRDVVPARLLPEARARRLAAKPATPIKGKSTRKAAPAAWWKRLLRLA